MRWKDWRLGAVALLIAIFSYYQIVTGNIIIPVIFTGIGLIVTIAQLPCFQNENKPTTSPTSGKRLWSPTFFFRTRLAQLRHAMGTQQGKEALTQYVSVCMLLLSFLFPLFLGVITTLSDNAAPRGSCTILTKVGISDEIAGMESATTDVYYQLRFTLRLQTNDKEVYSPVDGDTSVNTHQNGEFNTPEEAQQQLTHYLVGKTYSCQYKLLFHSVSSISLISDKPIASNAASQLTTIYYWKYEASEMLVKNALLIPFMYLLRGGQFSNLRCFVSPRERHLFLAVPIICSSANGQASLS